MPSGALCSFKVWSLWLLCEAGPVPTFHLLVLKLGIWKVDVSRSHSCQIQIQTQAVCSELPRPSLRRSRSFPLSPSSY